MKAIKPRQDYCDAAVKAMHPAFCGRIDPVRADPVLIKAAAALRLDEEGIVVNNLHARPPGATAQIWFRGGPAYAVVRIAVHSTALN